jgi:hypothetical protein
MNRISAYPDDGERPMIRKILRLALGLVQHALARLVGEQSAGHLVISLKTTRHEYDKRQGAREQPPVTWELRSSVWELRFCWRRRRLAQNSRLPKKRQAISRKGRSAAVRLVGQVAHPSRR